MTKFLIQGVTGKLLSKLAEMNQGVISGMVGCFDLCYSDWSVVD